MRCSARATRSRSARSTSRTPGASGSPTQLAVVGFDGLPEAPQFTPSLTTVRQPLAELGKLAVHELVEAVNAEDGAYTPHAMQLPVELIIGDSAPLASSRVAAAG